MSGFFLRIKSTIRDLVIEKLSDRISRIEVGHPVRVAIDGVDGAGKTWLADELVIPLEAIGRVVIRASVDGFHNPKTKRYKRGTNSPEGYYCDSFQYRALLDDLLLPLGPGGSLNYRSSVYDIKVEKRIYTQHQIASRDAILLFDGVFLLRSELINCWDLKIFVDVNFSTSVQRALDRDLPPDAKESEIETLINRYNQRYIPGQRFYFTDACPKEKADIILDNNRLEHPKIIKP